MRRFLATALTLGLASALFVAPTVSLPTAKATPVPPRIEVLTPHGVDPAALAEVRKAAPAVAATKDTATKNTATKTRTRTTALLTKALDTGRFNLVGVTWDANSVAATDPEVLVRVREEGRWTTWQALPVNDDGPDGDTAEGRASRQRAGTSPLLSGAADGVQVRVDTPSGKAPAGLRVSLIDPGVSPGDAALDAPLPPASASAATSAPAMVTRSQWGADESIAQPTSRNSTIKAMFVHHTASTNDYSGTAGAAAQIRAIYAYHVKANGWSDIGYNFLVDKAGTIFEGRKGSIDQLVQGAHTGGFNTDSMGVAALGNYEVAAAPAAMVSSIARVVAWKLGAYGRDPSGRTVLTAATGAGSRYAAGTLVTVNVIAGHIEVGQTACAGKYLNAQLGTIRSQASAVVARTPLSMTSPAATPTTPSYAAGSVAFSASLSAVVGWTVTVQSMCATTATRTFTGTSSRISASWDLKTSSGGWAAPGVYVVKYTAGNRAWTRDIEVIPGVGSPAGACTTSRIAGADRYATSVAAGRTAFATGISVVIVSGAQQNLVDGLVAGPLGFARKAPVLAVSPTSVPAVVATEIKRRRATTAWIVGGTGAVTRAVETQLRSLGVTTVRRLSGANRYATAAAVALVVKAPSKAVIVASGVAMADAVAASGPAARLNRPILLVSKDSVPAATSSTVKTLGVVTATVVGGPGVISERTRLALKLPSASRVSGIDRYATAAEISRVFSSLVGTGTMAVASGMEANLVDALAGGAMGRLTLLVRPTSVPGPAWTRLAAKSAGRVHVLGGTSAVDTATLRAVHLASSS